MAKGIDGGVVTPPARPLVAKLAAISGKIGSVPKDGTNDFHNYNYTSAEALLGRVQPLLAEVGVIACPRVEVVSHEDALCVVCLHVTFVDSESPDSLTVSALGSGADKGDKAVMKATTAAHKYLMRLVFTIPFGGDDPENSQASAAAEEAVQGAKKSKAKPKSAAGAKLQSELVASLANAQPSQAQEMKGLILASKSKLTAEAFQALRAAWVAKFGGKGGSE